MRNFILIVLLILVYPAVAQKVIKDITYLKLKGDKKNLEFSPVDTRKIIYFELTNQYILCNDPDRTPKPVPPGMLPFSTCSCTGEAPDPIPVSQLEYGDQFVERITSLKSNKTKDEWEIVFPSSQLVKGRSLKNINDINKQMKDKYPGKYAVFTTSPKNTCSIEQVNPDETEVLTASNDMSGQVVVNKICESEKLRPNFKIYSSVVDGASAVFHNNNRYILYSNDYIQRNIRRTHTQWTYYFIFAHEITHHLNGDMLDNPDPSVRRKYELDADIKAGRILHQMGAPLSKTLAWVKKVPPTDGDQYYPTRRERVNSVKKGWNSVKSPLTTYYWLAGGMSIGFGTTDTANYQSLDLYVHPPVGDILPHLALGINYLMYNSMTTKNASSSAGITIKAYVANYFKSKFNCSVSYTQGLDSFQSARLGFNLKVKDRADIELFGGVRSFTKNDYDKDLGNPPLHNVVFGASVHYCFLNKNNKAPKTN